tara:strand:- start:510 stop:749 length:240 start_codon:yes stop_codon:yes gene_type:complete
MKKLGLLFCFAMFSFSLSANESQNLTFEKQTKEAEKIVGFCDTLAEAVYYHHLARYGQESATSAYMGVHEQCYSCRWRE